jgi:hypothetical protein
VMLFFMAMLLQTTLCIDHIYIYTIGIKAIRHVHLLLAQRNMALPWQTCMDIL